MPVLGAETVDQPPKPPNLSQVPCRRTVPLHQGDGLLHGRTVLYTGTGKRGDGKAQRNDGEVQGEVIG